MMMANIEQEDKLQLAPKKFNMWIFIFTSFMLFAALTSGFIVYSGGHGTGINIKLPAIFTYSTILIALSSVSMYLASKAARELQLQKQRLFLWVTILLGVAFFALQTYAWLVLLPQMGVFFINPNASQSFIYVFVWIHLAHILAGVLLLGNTLLGAYRNKPQVKNLFGMQMSSIFWHFVDIIWIYLYVFLLLNQY
ncbi:cytochrome c oxidase subunit 3 [Mucilaginibacter psychrotolerans]|uniref:Heme-copper oxidase subunit III n=1 Tax=Mucilaginibacter psychrotolerans TaxID=1524096 RepID=A0A4Y8SHV5_9SPHI|nr:cytochrome c oxidase subunit 3 [Mucilaginibacter psychrotolerans]TFF38230.1 heme-copper oxidase subunit III [Mucilaginibacter psychrotolerans]